MQACAGMCSLVKTAAKTIPESFLAVLVCQAAHTIACCICLFNMCPKPAGGEKYPTSEVEVDFPTQGSEISMIVIRNGSLITLWYYNE